MITDRSEGDYSGMTLNERLVVANLLGNWDEAVMGRKREEMIGILVEVGLSKSGAEETVDLVLSDPERYGF